MWEGGGGFLDNSSNPPGAGEGDVCHIKRQTFHFEKRGEGTGGGLGLLHAVHTQRVFLVFLPRGGAQASSCLANFSVC